MGSRFSPEARRLRDFAARNRLPHRWIDLEKDPQAEAVLRELGVGPEDTPVVIWGARQLLRNPSNAELARAIGLAAPTAEETICDLVVVGAGPAGLGQPCMERRRVWQRSWSTPSPRAGRPRLLHGSRTI
jgi:thioredoxin reductase (NADPH)